jgi:hypothetical protein
MVDLKKLIVNILGEKPTFSKKELFERLKAFGSEINKTSLTWQLHQLKNQGAIQNSGRGIYSLNSKSIFYPEVSSSLKRIYNKISKEFPFLQICVWDSRWFNNLMLHQLFKYYLVIEVEKDSAESVFNTMTDVSKKVFLNPTEDIFTRYISNFNEVIIVKSLISESPISEHDSVKIASLEKLLVDCIAEKDLYAAQQSEIDFIFRTAAEKYTINESKLKRYARRRNQLEKIEGLIGKTSAKKV